ILASQLFHLIFASLYVPSGLSCLVMSFGRMLPGRSHSFQATDRKNKSFEDFKLGASGDKKGTPKDLTVTIYEIAKVKYRANPKKPRNAANKMKINRCNRTTKFN